MADHPKYDPDEVESKYEFEAMPVFKSKIPAYLTENLDKKEAYIVETVSIMEQSVQWNTERIEVLSVATVEQDKFKQWALKKYSAFVSKWTIVYAILAWASAVFLSPLIHKWWEGMSHK